MHILLEANSRVLGKGRRTHGCDFYLELSSEVLRDFCEHQVWSLGAPTLTEQLQVKTEHLEVSRAVVFNLTLVRNVKRSYRNRSDKRKQHLVSWLLELPAQTAPTLLLWAKEHKWPTWEPAVDSQGEALTCKARGGVCRELSLGPLTALWQTGVNYLVTQVL